jgi:phosphinothricin acetyltransferase
MIDQSASSQRKGVTIERLEARDWEAVRAILLEGIATGQAAFETEAPDWEMMEWRSEVIGL